MTRESSARFDPIGSHARSLTTASRAPYVVTGCRKDATRRLMSAGRHLFDDTLTTTSQSASALFKRGRETFSDRLTLGRSLIHGYGLVAKRSHAKGELICEYVGEVVREVVADFRERDALDVESERGLTFIFALDERKRLRIDATRAGNLARLANHSCQPNARAELVHRDGAARVCLFAIREIAPGEEITYDYELDSSEALPCRCGARRCRGFVNASLRRRLRSSA